jgi:hypothetical protein
MATRKGRKVPQLRKTSASNSLDVTKFVAGFSKSPGQTGLHAPQSLDAIRKPSPGQRQKGAAMIGGISKPRVADQTYDCYKPSRRVVKKRGNR